MLYVMLHVTFANTHVHECVTKIDSSFLGKVRFFLIIAVKAHRAQRHSYLRTYETYMRFWWLAMINNGNGVDHDSMTVDKTSSKQVAFTFRALKIHYVAPAANFSCA